MIIQANLIGESDKDNPVKKHKGGRGNLSLPILFIIVQICTCACTIYYAMHFSEYIEAREEYDEIKEDHLDNTSDLPTTNELDGVDDSVSNQDIFEASDISKIPEHEINHRQLDIINSDYACWIYAPGTQIDYPVCQGKDNEFYLNHTLKKTENFSGCLFMDANTSIYDNNTFIYGHNMKNGTMFGELQDIGDYFYIYSPVKSYKCHVFSTYVTEPDSATFVYVTPQYYKTYLQYAINSSDTNYGFSIKPNDKIFTLSTCVGSGSNKKRYIVHAVVEE